MGNHLMLFQTLVALSGISNHTENVLPAICGYKGPKLQRLLNQQQTQQAKRSTGPKIVTGAADFIKNHPWQAAIVTVEKEHLCGGSVISKFHVLSAAHCFYAENPKSVTAQMVSRQQLLVVVSSNSPTENGDYYNISRLELHKSYGFSWGGFRNDVALLKVDGQFTWTLQVFPLCLPKITEEYSKDRSCVISGFGQDGYDTSVGLLKFGDVDIQSDEECKANYGSTNITEGMFCASGLTFNGNIIDTCKGDSGGPLYCPSSTLEAQYVLLGVTSFGGTCGQNRPGVYVKVSEYLSWIHEMIKITTKLEAVFSTVSSNPVRNRTWRDILPENCGLHDENLREFFVTNSSRRVPRLVNGEISQVESRPWQVAVLYAFGGIRGGGSIISKNHVLTTSHCFYSVDKQNNYVIVGKNERIIAVVGSQFDNGMLKYSIEQFFVHSFLTGNPTRNDIAVVKIDGDFTWSAKIFPICLPRQDEPYEDRRQCSLSGYGYPGKQEFPRKLRSGDVQLISLKSCKEKIADLAGSITKGMVCAVGITADNKTIAPCAGDSGSSLQCADENDCYRLVGVATFLFGVCDKVEGPGIYTKVSKYLDWIYERLEVSMGYRTWDSLKPEKNIVD